MPHPFRSSGTSSARILDIERSAILFDSMHARFLRNFMQIISGKHTLMFDLKAVVSESLEILLSIYDSTISMSRTKSFVYVSEV